MSEIYWLTRLDAINMVCWLVIIIAGVVCFILGFAGRSEDDEQLKIAAKKLAIMFAVSGLGLLFIPTKKEMLMILGLGQTIDYIQENETIKELPDKCVEALDAWVESLTKEE